MKFRWYPDALDEFQDASFFYARQAAGLGLRFEGVIESAIRDICQNPHSWPTIYSSARRRIVFGFPFTIIYTIESNFVVIIAVMRAAANRPIGTEG